LDERLTFSRNVPEAVLQAAQYTFALYTLKLYDLSRNYLSTFALYTLKVYDLSSKYLSIVCRSLLIYIASCMAHPAGEAAYQQHIKRLQTGINRAERWGCVHHMNSTYLNSATVQSTADFTLFL